MIRLYVAATVALLAGQACGSARSSPTRPAPGGSAGSAAPSSSGHVASASDTHVDTTPAVPDHPSEQDCDALFAHTVAVDQEQRPADQRLAEPELAAVRAKLREQHLPACRELSRASYRCMLAASTPAALTSCP